MESCTRFAALVGEKGYANVELTVSSPGGHSAVPPRESAVGILARAITRIEANPMPTRMEDPVQKMFRWLGPSARRGHPRTRWRYQAGSPEIMLILPLALVHRNE